MELFSAEFFSALLAIIVIDLVLAGDNAIVIALAARSLPPELRKKAIIWGTFGAIAVRTALTMVVVWLLKIPGLLLMGGALLVWIAYKLLADNDNSGHEVSAAGSFWGAMKTIVVADAVMGLDNVLAVAGAAHGSFLLVVIGLLISIPIVIWGSQLILKFVERFPAIIYVGGAVLAWTAAKMMVSEPLVRDHLQNEPLLTALVYAVVMIGVLGGGYLASRAGSVRVGVVEHAAAQGKSAGTETEAGNITFKGGAIMQRILIPVDGSENALAAVRHAAGRFDGDPEREVHLLFVRNPLLRLVPRYASRRDRLKFRNADAEQALAPARELLDRFGLAHAEHVETGSRAAVIHRTAQRLAVGRIVMGAARRFSLTRVFENMVAGRLLEITGVPVELVAGKSVSKIERIGVPAGLGAVLTSLLVVVD